MWRWEDVMKMWWRCDEDVMKMRRSEDEKKWWRCDEDVNTWRCEHMKMYSKPLLLEEPFAQTLSGQMVELIKAPFLSSSNTVFQWINREKKVEILRTNTFVYIEIIETIISYPFWFESCRRSGKSPPRAHPRWWEWCARTAPSRLWWRCTTSWPGPRGQTSAATAEYPSVGWYRDSCNLQMDDFKQIKATKTLDMICKTFISFGSNMIKWIAIRQGP